MRRNCPQAANRPGIKADDQGNISPNVNVTFKQGLNGSDFVSMVAHEGSHVADNLSFINSFSRELGTFDASKNFTIEQMELKGYQVQLSVILGSLGHGNEYKLLGQTFSPADTQTKIDKKISQGLRDPGNGYAGKLMNLEFGPDDYPQK